MDKFGRGMMEQKKLLLLFRDDITHTHTHTIEKWTKIREVHSLKEKHKQLSSR